MTFSITAINELSASWGPLLWRACWQGGLALLFVLLLGRMVRSIPARVQCWLWRLAYAKLLIAGLWIAPVELHWLPPPEPAATVAVIPSAPVADDHPINVPAPVIVPPVVREAPPPQLTGMSWLLLAWIIGAAVLLVRQFWHVVRIQHLRSRLTVLNDERTLRDVDVQRKQMGIRRRPELRVSTESISPFLMGLFRPVIVLPAVILQSCSTAQWDAALMHELAHVRRRDLLWNWLPAIAEALFFFHPLVWLARREWRLSQEMAADEMAISSARLTPAQYADALVELIAKCPSVTRCPHLAISLSPAYSQLKRRVIAMQSLQPLTTPRRRGLAALVLTLAMLGIVPWKLVAQESPVPATEQFVATTAQNEPESLSQTVSGTVVDAAGRSIAGATVVAGSFSDPLVRETLTTDSAGRFETQLALGTMPLVVAHKEGLALASHWFSGESEPSDVTLVLNKPITFVGKVHDTEGRPIPGAIVRVEIFSIEEGFNGWNYLFEKVLAGTALHQYATTTTNADGAFRFSAFPEAARAMLKVTAKGYGLLRTMSYFDEPDKQFYQGTEDAPAVLTLDKEGVVEGRVTTTLDGVSVEGLRVHLQESHNSPVIAEPGFVVTDAEGRFRFSGLAEGTANVFLTEHEPDGPWTYRAAADVPIQPGEQAGVDIKLIKGHFVEGQVVSTSGEPVADAHVGVYGPIRPQSGGAIIGYLTKEDGKYRFHLPPGKAYIYISGVAPGYTGRDSAFVDVPEGEGTIIGPTFTLKPTIGLRCRIFEIDGSPATDIEIVRVSNTKRWFDFSRQPIKVGTDGRFELRRDDPVNLAAGNKLSLRIRRPNGQEVDVQIVPEADQEHEIRLPPKDPANTSTEPEGTTRTITIRVVDKSGHPVEGAKVFRNHVYKLEGQERPKIENKEYWTAADGKAVVSLSGESVDLRLWATKEAFIPLHAMWARESQADGDRIPREFTFQLQPGTEIGGIVKDERGEPIEGVKIEVHDATAEQFHMIDPSEPGVRPVRSYSLAEGDEVVTDAEGRWTLGNVPHDEMLTFPDSPRYNRAGPKISLRLSHPDYLTVKEWGAVQKGQFVTHQELRDQTAAIVLKRAAP